ncbi:MAG: sigma-70 family RNA polymerase sigma factor [Deltaproteobacteria bacterium]|nr:MAG: sigma-70 family RNA polymerase sigma factor [Deltaproteobacteria bacterium]
MYAELRRLAVFHLRREPRARALEPTELVSEVYLRLATAHLEFSDRTHFFAVASRNMRQILTDQARRQSATKRGSGERTVELDETQVATDQPPELAALRDALADLVKFDERKARVIALRYFGGLTRDEIATACGIHANTVSRDLRASRAWLRCRLQM